VVRFLFLCEFYRVISKCSPSKKNTSGHRLPDLRQDLKSLRNLLEQTFKISKFVKNIFLLEESVKATVWSAQAGHQYGQRARIEVGGDDGSASATFVQTVLELAHDEAAELLQSAQAGTPSVASEDREPGRCTSFMFVALCSHT
jgi:hypothetical protein